MNRCPITNKPYFDQITPTGLAYREWPEGVPDLTLDDLKWNRDRRLTTEEIGALRAGEWFKYYMWLCTQISKKR